VNAPTEPVNLASLPEHKEVIEKLSKFLPPPIPPADPNAVKIPKGKKNLIDVDAKNRDEDAPGKPSVPSAQKPDQTVDEKTKERIEGFEKRDLNKDGKLSREEFMIKQKDPEHAAQNFIKWDKDKSGDISKEEYVNMSK
jgi:hypothetical protein